MAFSSEEELPPAAGFYVAHHPWLDQVCGPAGTFKVGFSSDLSRRLSDSCYTTCFSSGWRYLFTLETEAAENAHLIESSVLYLSSAFRLEGKELVSLPLETIRTLSLWSAGLLSIPVIPPD